MLTAVVIEPARLSGPALWSWSLRPMETSGSASIIANLTPLR